MSYDRATAPRVSVVVPCRDGARLLPETLRAVLTQTFGALEVVVVDDGSQDDTAVVAAAFAVADDRVKVVSRRHEDGDPGAARAAGAEVARGSILWFLDADDIPARDVVAQIVGYLDGHPDVGAVALGIRVVDGSRTEMTGRPLWGEWWVPTRFSLRRMRPGERQIHPVAILGSACLISSALCCRRAAYDAAGGWLRQDDRGYEDSDLALRLALCAPMHRLPEAVVSYRVHPGQFSATATEALRRTEQRFQARWRDEATVRPAWRPALREALALYDRRVTPRIAVSAALTHLRARRPQRAARFLLSALRTWLVSYARNPPARVARRVRRVRGVSG